MVGGSIKSYLLKRVSTVRIRPGAPEICRARYHHGAGLFWSKGRIRAVDARVTHFPAGGVFESARGHQRNIEPGTATVPGSSGLRAGFEPSTPASLISPRGSFRIRPGAPEEYRTRYRYGAGFFWFNAMSKTKRPFAGKQAGACERICLRRKP